MSQQITPKADTLSSAREEARYQEARWLELENLVDEATITGSERLAALTFRRDVQYKRWQAAHQDFLDAKNA